MARKYSKKASTDVERAMKKRKAGTLKSGRSGRKVTSRKQAIAIGLSEARAKGKKVPKKAAKKRKAAKKEDGEEVEAVSGGSLRHCEEQSDEAIQNPGGALDCFASLAMTSRGMTAGLTPPCAASPPTGAPSSPPGVPAPAAKPEPARASPPACPSGWPSAHPSG